MKTAKTLVGVMNLFTALQNILQVQEPQKVDVTTMPMADVTQYFREIIWKHI